MFAISVVLQDFLSITWWEDTLHMHEVGSEKTFISNPT